MKENMRSDLYRALDSLVPNVIKGCSRICIVRVLIGYAGMNEHMLAYPSVSVLCRQTDLSRRTVQACLKELVDIGALSVDDSQRIPYAKSNVYDLNSLIVLSQKLKPDEHQIETAQPLRPSQIETAQPLRPSQVETAQPLRPSQIETAQWLHGGGAMVARGGRNGCTQYIDLKIEGKEEEEDARDDHAHHENHPANHHPLTSDQDLDLPHEDGHDRDRLESGKQPETPENRSPDPERSDAPETQGEPRDRDDSGQDDPVKMESWLANKLQLWHKEFSPGGRPPEIYHAQRIVTYATDAKIFETKSSGVFCRFIMDRLRHYMDRESVPHTRQAIGWLNDDLKERFKDHEADHESTITIERERQARLDEMASEKRREEEDAARLAATEDGRKAKSGHLPHYRTDLELDLLKVAISFAASGMVPIGDEVRQDVIDIELVAAANSEYTLNTVTWCELVATCQSLPCWKAAHPGADT